MTPAEAEVRAQQVLKDLKSRLRQEPNIVVGRFWALLSLEPPIRRRLEWRDDEFQLVMDEWRQGVRAIRQKYAAGPQARATRTKKRDETIKLALREGYTVPEDILNFVKQISPELVAKNDDGFIDPKIMMKNYRHRRKNQD
jgi:hypothetical protein